MAISTVGVSNAVANRDDGATVQYSLNVTGGYTKKLFTVVTGSYSLKLFGIPGATGTYGIVTTSGSASGITNFTFPADGEYSTIISLNSSTDTGFFIGNYTGSAILRAWNQDGVATTLATPAWSAVTLNSNPSNAWYRPVSNTAGTRIVTVYPNANSTQAGTSTNGVDWTGSYPGTANQWYGWYGPFYANGRWILLDPSATGTGHKIVTTTDGTTWTTYAQTASNYFGSTITYCNGAYLMTNFAGTSGVFRSTDLTNWTNYSVNGQTINYIASNGTVTLTAVLYNNSTYYYSTDGQNWTSANIPSNFNNGTNYVEWVGDRFIMWNNQNSQCYWSYTGTGSWTGFITSGIPTYFNCPSWSKIGNFFYYTQAANGQTYYSSDLTTWTSSGTQFTTAATNGAVLNGKIYRFKDYNVLYSAGANNLS